MSTCEFWSEAPAYQVRSPAEAAETAPRAASATTPRPMNRRERRQTRVFMARSSVVGTIAMLRGPQPRGPEGKPRLVRGFCGGRALRGLLLEPRADAVDSVGVDVDAELRAIRAHVRDALRDDVDDAPLAAVLEHHEVDFDLGAVVHRDDRVHVSRRLRGIAGVRQHA